MTIVEFIIHFGTKAKIKEDGMRLTRNNYVRINNRSSIIEGRIYTDNECKKLKELALRNFDINMEYFKSLNGNEFNQKLNAFLLRNPGFIEVFDLNMYHEVPGYYLMVLDEYKQVYIGTSADIKKRIKGHWALTFPLDRLVFGSVTSSVLSINSFRALDTTRIFAYRTDKTFSSEDAFINDFPEQYHLNRTKGGMMEDGYFEAISHGKTRQMV